MHRSAFAFLALLSSLSLGWTAKAKAKMTVYDNEDYAPPSTPQAQAEYYAVQDASPQQMQAAAFNQQASTGEGFSVTSSYQQPVQNVEQYQTQNPTQMQRFAQQQPMQAANAQQASFLGTAAEQAPQQPVDGTAVLNQMTQVIQQQTQAFSALKAEQQQLVRLQSDFTERSLQLFERLAKTPRCDKMTTPNKVNDEESCDSACAGLHTGNNIGTYKENEWSGLFGENSLTSKTYRCVCAPDGKDITICNNHVGRMTTSFLGLLALAIASLHI